MIIWKAFHTHMIAGTILCLGSLSGPDKLLISSGALAAGASLQPAVSEPALAGAPQILGPRARNPLAAVHWEPRPAMPAIHDASKQIDTAREMPLTMSIQRALSSLGYDPGPIDGLMGPRTHGAIVAYEKARGWDSSGMVGSRLRDGLIADLPPESPVLPVSGRDGDSGALLSVIRSPATATNPTDTEAATNRPVSILEQGAAANAVRCQAAEAEPGSDIEFAVAELFHAMRATAQFAVRIFVGPRSRDIATTKDGSGMRGYDRPAAIRNGTGSHCSSTSGRIARAAAGTRASGALSGRVHPANSP